MRFSLKDSRTFANFSFKGVWGHKAISSYQLTFQLEANVFTVAEGRKPKLRHFSAALYLKTKSGDLLINKMFEKDGRRSIQAHPHSHIPYFQFVTKLTANEMGEIERQRDGGDITFVVKLYGEMNDDDYVMEGSEEVECRLEQSAWLKQLNQMEYSDILLLEFDLKNMAPEATKKFKEAQASLQKGSYRESVGLCRDVLEALALQQMTEPKPDKQNTKPERLKLFHQKLVHFTHLARHNNNEAAQTAEWDREDAMFALMATAALLRKEATGLN